MITYRTSEASFENRLYFIGKMKLYELGDYPIDSARSISTRQDQIPLYSVVYVIRLYKMPGSGIRTMAKVDESNRRVESV